MTLPFGAKFDLLISFEFQGKVSQHLKVPLYEPFLTTSTRAGYLNVLKPTFENVFLKSGGTKSSCNSNLFDD